MPHHCVIVQSDLTVLLERNSPDFDSARDLLLRFAELEKCPEHIHSYRITPLSLWNAAALGLDPTSIAERLSEFSRFPVPSSVKVFINDTMRLYGMLRLVRDHEGVWLEIDDHRFLNLIWSEYKINCFLEPGQDRTALRLRVQEHARGHIKVAFIERGFPVDDQAGHRDGEPFPISLRDSWALRDYQKEASLAFYREGEPRSGAGVLVLPCGAGKTVIGIDVMARLGMRTLIMCPGVTAARQWRDEILARTDCRPEDIGEYTGQEKEIRPITFTTYQMLTSRKSKNADFEHLHIIARECWGLLIYDEVHLLPAPIFKATASLQACRRLGLTATLVREDNHEREVFSLIGPKKYDIPWKTLEHRGWVAKAHCQEVRVNLSDVERTIYEAADKRAKFRIAACCDAKIEAVFELLRQHADDQVLIIGMYLDQIHRVAEAIGIPVIEGNTPQKQRDAWYKAFKTGELKWLALSKVGNFSVDLPDASVAIQISGMFGSRQEEAQRLGRILRPKPGANQARFYTVVAANTEESSYAMHRQLFLVEQGYEYEISRLVPCDVDEARTDGLSTGALSSEGESSESESLPRAIGE